MKLQILKLGVLNCCAIITIIFHVTVITNPHVMKYNISSWRSNCQWLRAGTRSWSGLAASVSSSRRPTRNFLGISQMSLISVELHWWCVTCSSSWVVGSSTCSCPFPCSHSCKTGSCGSSLGSWVDKKVTMDQVCQDVIVHLLLLLPPRPPLLLLLLGGLLPPLYGLLR